MKADDNEYFKEGRMAMKQTLILRDIGEERRAESQNEEGRMAEKQILVGEKKERQRNKSQ